MVVLLGVLPVAALAVSSVHSASNALSGEVKLRVRSASALTAVAIRNEIVGVEQLVDSYAARQRLVEALQKGDRRTIAVQLEGLQRARPGIATTFIARMNGRLVSIVPATPSIIGKDFSFRDWYKGVTRTRRTYVSQAYESQATGHPLVVAVTTLIRGPVSRGRAGRPIGILVAAYGLGAMERFTESFARSESLELTLTDQRGVVLASPTARHGLVSLRGDPAVSAALRGSGGVMSTGRSGGNQLVAYQPVAGLGWAVTVGVPKRTALAALGGVRSAVYEAAGLLELALLVGLGLMVRSSRSRQRAEEAAERSRRDAQEARDQAERARTSAERANRAKSEFLSRMSHELRTPLNSVLGFAQLLELGELAEPERDNVRQIIGAGDHLLALINEVLDIARIEAGKMSLSLEPVSVSETLGQTLELIAPIAAERHVTLSSEEVDEAVFVYADRQRLKQVLLNLLSNAVKYNHEDGAVTVSVEANDNGRVRIQVSDTGEGIPPERLDELFVAFERLGVESGPIEGTGLGLALARGLAEAMGGELGVRSELGKGSTFWVELEPATSELALAAGYDGAPGEAHASSSVGHVLYIEDNRANIDLVQRAFEQLSGIRLTIAMEGHLGLELARSQRPDLILLDLHLPDTDGEKVLAALRADERTASLPVIVLTADATPGRRERLQNAGANGYLTKPLDLKRLFELLHTHLASAQPAEDNQHAADPILVGAAAATGRSRP